MTDRISHHRQIRLIVTLPPRLPSFQEEDTGRGHALATLVSTVRGIPRAVPLGSSPIYLPIRPMADTELLAILWEAAKLVQEP